MQDIASMIVRISAETYAHTTSVISFTTTHKQTIKKERTTDHPPLPNKRYVPSPPRHHHTHFFSLLLGLLHILRQTEVSISTRVVVVVWKNYSNSNNIIFKSNTNSHFWGATDCGFLYCLCVCVCVCVTRGRK